MLLNLRLSERQFKILEVPPNVDPKLIVEPFAREYGINLEQKAAIYEAISQHFANVKPSTSSPAPLRSSSNGFNFNSLSEIPGQSYPDTEIGSPFGRLSNEAKNVFLSSEENPPDFAPSPIHPLAPLRPLHPFQPQGLDTPSLPNQLSFTRQRDLPPSSFPTEKNPGLKNALNSGPLAKSTKELLPSEQRKARLTEPDFAERLLVEQGLAGRNPAPLQNLPQNLPYNPYNPYNPESNSPLHQKKLKIFDEAPTKLVPVGSPSSQGFRARSPGAQVGDRSHETVSVGLGAASGNSSVKDIYESWVGKMRGQSPQAGVREEVSLQRGRGGSSLLTSGGPRDRSRSRLSTSNVRLTFPKSPEPREKPSESLQFRPPKQVFSFESGPGMENSGSASGSNLRSSEVTNRLYNLAAEHARERQKYLDARFAEIHPFQPNISPSLPTPPHELIGKLSTHSRDTKLSSLPSFTPKINPVNPRVFEQARELRSEEELQSRSKVLRKKLLEVFTFLSQGRETLDISDIDSMTIRNELFLLLKDLMVEMIRSTSRLSFDQFVELVVRVKLLPKMEEVHAYLTAASKEAPRLQASQSQKRLKSPIASFNDEDAERRYMNYLYGSQATHI